MPRRFADIHVKGPRQGGRCGPDAVC